jgi:L-asparaginase
MAEQTSSAVFSSSLAETQSGARTLVVLGTGGTIAGEGASADDDLSYRSAALPVAALVGSLAPPPGWTLESEQVAQLDSKDMDFATWRRLALCLASHLARAEVGAAIVTHGSDTLEETAYWLARALAPRKPVVLTAAMRPATSAHADGPRNLRDAATVATAAGARGVVVVVAGSVHSALDVRKVHPQRLDAFDSGDAGPIARVVDGDRLRLERDWPASDPQAALDSAALPEDPARWPWVAILPSGAGADPRAVRALVDAGVEGIVVATTGNGTVHRALEAPLAEAAARGCAVLRATRCLAGAIVEPADAASGALPSAGALTPQQARVELIVRLLAARASSAG